MKRHRYRSVKNYCKASKIHSFGDMRPEHKKREVRKVDEINRLIIKNPIKRWEHACFQRFLRFAKKLSLYFATK